MGADNSMEFQLDGIAYTLHGDMDKAKMERIVESVEKKISEVREQAPYYSRVRAATLAAILLAEELYDVKEEYATLVGEADTGEDTLFD
jgi:cell division protein ZapA (FtsZ GTPase activity inhibitor)